MVEISIFSFRDNPGKFVYEISTFIGKCQSSADVFFDKKPEDGPINTIRCPVVDKPVRFSGTICLGPEDKSGCEFNTAT